MFKEAYSNWSICYCAPLGLGSRPFIAPKDKRPASTIPGDYYSKQSRRELLNYHHLEGNIKMLNDVNFLFIFKFGCTTVRDATFNMRGQLYRGHANATALFSSAVVSALGSESDDPGSSPGGGKALCP